MRYKVMNKDNDGVIPSEGMLVIREIPRGLPHPDHISFFALEKQRRVYLEGEVDANCLQIQRLILRWNLEDMGIPAGERRPIWILIHSHGGDVSMMWGLIDAIETSVTPVYTVNMGMAGSAAGLIFMAGKTRLMMPRSRVLIHEGSCRMSGDAVKVLDASDSYRRAIKDMKEYIRERTGITQAMLTRQESHDWELDAESCLKHRVCDKVIRIMDEILTVP